MTDVKQILHAYIHTYIQIPLGQQSWLHIEKKLSSISWSARLIKLTGPILPTENYCFLNPICCPGGGTLCPPCWLFDRCISSGRAFKLILCDFSSNFIFNTWPVNFFWSVEQFTHSLFVCDRQRQSLIMELSIHCYTALVLEIGCQFGYFIAT